MSDNTLLVMTTAVVVTSAGLVRDTLTVKFDTKTRKSSVSLARPKIKPVIGGFLLGLFLFGMNAVSDQVTRAVCILLIITALLMEITPIMTALNVGKVI